MPRLYHAWCYNCAVKRPSTAGFTLIETVVTIFLIAVIVAVYAAMTNIVTLNRDVQHQGLAVRIAASELDLLRHNGYSSLPASGTFTSSQLANLPQGAGALTVTNYNAKTKQVAVTVSWQDPGKSARSVSLTTLITATGGL